jgi:hypothetical protein
MRQNMADKSGASRMNPKTQVAELHGRPILDLSNHTLEENIYYALAKVMPEEADVHTVNVLLNLFMRLEDGEMEAVRRARACGASPNAYLASALAAVGDHPLLSAARAHTRFVIDLIRELGLDDDAETLPASLDMYVVDKVLTQDAPEIDETTAYLLKEVMASRKPCVALRVCQHIIKIAEQRGLHIHNLYAFLLASIAVCILWRPMLRKRMSRQAVEDAISYFYVLGRLFACSVIDPDKNKHWQKITGKQKGNLRTSLTETAFRFLFNRKPTDTELAEFKYLVGLTLTNGPGTISAKGAKESVSARNHVSMAYVGFPWPIPGSPTAATALKRWPILLENFRNADLKDPGAKDHGIDLAALATSAVKAYAEFKQEQKDLGVLRVKADPVHQPPGLQGRGGQHRSARGLHPQAVRAGRHRQRVPGVLPSPRQGASGPGRHQQRILRKHRRGAGRHRPQARLVGALRRQDRRAADPGPGLHPVPLRPGHRRNRRNRRPPRPRPRHGLQHPAVKRQSCVVIKLSAVSSQLSAFSRQLDGSKSGRQAVVNQAVQS